MPEQFKPYTPEEAWNEAELMKEKITENEKLSYSDAQKEIESDKVKELKRKWYKKLIADPITEHSKISSSIGVDTHRQPELPNNLKDGLSILEYLRSNNLLNDCFGYEDLLLIQQSKNASNTVEAYGNGIIGWKGATSAGIPFLIRNGREVRLLWRNVNDDFSIPAMHGVAMGEFADRIHPSLFRN